MEAVKITTLQITELQLQYAVTSSTYLKSRIEKGKACVYICIYPIKPKKKASSAFWQTRTLVIESNRQMAAWTQRLQKSKSNPHTSGLHINSSFEIVSSNFLGFIYCFIDYTQQIFLIFLLFELAYVYKFSLVQKSLTECFTGKRRIRIAWLQAEVWKLA